MIVHTFLPVLLLFMNLVTRNLTITGKRFNFLYLHYRVKCFWSPKWWKLYSLELCCSVCVVQGPAASPPPGSLFKMQNQLNQNLHCNNIPGWWAFTVKYTQRCLQLYTLYSGQTFNSCIKRQEFYVSCPKFSVAMKSVALSAPVFLLALMKAKHSKQRSL